MPDEYTNNNKVTSKISIPEILPNKFLLHIEAQGLGRAQDNAYIIIDEVGEILYSKEYFEDNEIYEE